MLTRLDELRDQIARMDAVRDRLATEASIESIKRYVARTVSADAIAGGRGRCTQGAASVRVPERPTVIKTVILGEHLQHALERQQRWVEDHVHQSSAVLTALAAAPTARRRPLKLRMAKASLRPSDAE